MEEKFELTRVPQGRFILRVSLVGYPTRFIPDIAISANNSNMQLGAIPMRGSATRLKEVQIVTERPIEAFEQDKRVVNVSQAINTESGSVAEVMQNLPSVTVDMDGNCEHRPNERSGDDEGS